MEALSARERLVLLVTKSIREDFLFQNAFDMEDARTPLKKQYLMLKTLLTVFNAAQEVIKKDGFDIADLRKLPVLEKVAKVKEIPPDDENKFQLLMDDVTKDIAGLA